MERAARALSARVDSVRRLEGGYSNLSVLLSTSVGAVVARHPTFAPGAWHPTLHGQATAMRLARDAGLPVPEVVYVDDDMLVYQYVDGRPLTAQDAASGLAFEAGELFARLHSIAGDGLGPVQADGNSPGWTNDAYFSGAATMAARLLSLHDSTWGIDAADIEAAAQLLIEAPPMRSQLVHGDAGVGNLIVDGGRIAGVIDFDNACYGDPAIDLAWWWWRSPRTASAFEAGCAAQGDTTDPWPLWACRTQLLLGLADSFVANAPERARYVWELLPTAVRGLRDAAR